MADFVILWDFCVVCLNTPKGTSINLFFRKASVKPRKSPPAPPLSIKTRQPFLQTLKIAIPRECLPKKQIYRDTLKSDGLLGHPVGHPVSRKGDCWDNAPMESFFGALKTECLHHYKFKTRDQAKQVVFEYIEVFYNRIRRHATIQNQVPADYANQSYKNELQIAA